jgi:hypothetical protein
VQGAVALRISPEERLDIALSASRLDLGQWLPTLPALQDAALPVGLDLSADAAQLGGGTLRRLRAALDLSAGEATLREATALLPGEADLRVTGRMERAGPTVGAFSGALRFAAPDLRATLRWLDQIGAIRLAALPPGVLRSATLSGALTAQDNSFIVHDMTGKIDGGPVAGSLRLVAGRQPWLEADLRTDRLALDPWLPAEPPGAGFAASLPEGRLKLLARRAVLRGVAVDDLQLDASAQGGRLVGAALEGAARGARFRASGGFADGDRLADAHLTVNAADASSLLPLVPPEWRGAPELWAGPLDLDIAADGHLETLAVRAALDLDDARLEAQPVIDLMHRRWRGPVTLRHPGASRLLAAAGLLPSARWIGEGSLALIGRFSGEPGRIAADSFDLVAGGMRATGALALDRSEAGPNLTGRVAAETLPLVLPDFSDTAPLPVDALHGWRASVKVEAGTLLAGQRPLIERAAALVSLDSGRLHLDQRDGRFAGGTLAGSADFDASGPVPSLVLDAALGGADAGALAGDVPVGPIAGRIDAELALTARGHSPAALLATAAGTLRVTATGGTLSGFSLGRMREALEAARGDPLPVTDAAVRAALAGGTSPFDSFRLEGRLEHGEFAVTSAALSGADGAANASGTIGLPSGLLDLHATVRPAVEDPPELGLRITGPADRPRQVPELTGLARWAGDHPPP